MPEPSALISACILARNEEHRIEDALRSLQGWTDQIIVLDNESEDQTAAVASRYADLVLTVPRANNFDGARNLAVDHASGDWIFYLDADERVPPGLGALLRRLVQQQGGEFEALLIPFKHYFCGQWIRHSGWWPGYTRPQLLKKGAFHYNSRLHSGISVEGRTRFFPDDDPDLAIVHYSYDDLHHYLEKFNRYTDGEAESLLADGGSHSWQAQLAHFVHDWQVYYERHQGDRDGMGGFVLAFLSGFYRFASRAKLWDLRRQRGELTGPDPVPGSLREMLEFMARVCQEGAQPWLDGPQSAAPPQHAPDALAAESLADPSRSFAETPRLPLLWCAPLADASGYADEARNFVLGLVEAGEPLSVCPLVWSEERAGLSSEMEALLQERTVPPGTPSDIFVSQTLPLLQRPSPHALVNVARTMFETDGLPPGAVQALNRMDRVWVPSEFNRETFAQSGVVPEKIAVIPGALDPAPFAAALNPWPVPGGEAFRFLSVFDWTRHKGWDVLLEAFAQEFGDDPRVGLVLKTWSSNGYALEDIRAQADAWLQEKLGRSLESFPNIHLWQERLPAGEMPRLYRAADCFVLPTRGEGWGRPLMEAMAAGLPTIATAWSGLTEFHDARVGYPLKYALEPVSEAGAREIPLYAGHRWAEPDLKDLRRLMRRIVGHPEAARKKGRAAQKAVAARYSRPAVAALLQDEIAYCRTLAASRLDALRLDALRDVESKARDAAEAGAGPRASGPVPSRRPGPAQPASNPPNVSPSPALRPAANLVPVESLPAVDFQATLGRPLRVRWEGDQSLRSSLAHVNRELCLGLLERGDVELSLAEQAGPWHTLTERDEPRLAALAARLNAPLSGPVDVTIRHHFPPDWRRPETGKLVVMQPWEWGHLPGAWVEGAARHADEVWAYSRFVRDVYVRSGVPAEKVHVVPLGIRPGVFTPDGPVYSVPTRKATRFLFVGGALERKGADLLLEAYRRAFTRTDDVCLVVKDMGTQTFYKGQTFADDYRRAQDDTGGPEVVYLDGDLPENELASLYRACTCVVLPYRAEGFGLSPLEGMACGRPAIVTAGGPTDDYLDDALALRVPFRRKSQGNRIGPWECAGDPWHLEPDPDALADALRWVQDHPEETRQRGAEARAHAQAGWTWERSVDTARLRLWKLVRPPQDQTIQAARPVELAELQADAQDQGLQKQGHQDQKQGHQNDREAPQDAPEENTPEDNQEGKRREEGRQPRRHSEASALSKPGKILESSESVRAAALEGVGTKGSHESAGEHELPLAISNTVVPNGSPVLDESSSWTITEEPGLKGTGPNPEGTGSQGRQDELSLCELSLCMIVRDEEDRVEACLKSIAPFVDEMIVVDTGSTDDTRQVALRCGARVFDYPWTDSFAEARNQSLAQARGKWIFWMDADDVIPPECGRQLRELARNHPEVDKAFLMQVRIPPGPGEFSGSVVDHVKLFPNRQDLRFEHRIHEQILPALRRAVVPVEFSDLYVTHQNYDRSPEGQAKKRRRDFRLLELDLADRPDHPFVLFNLGMTCLYATREYELAVHYLRRSLAGSHPQDSIVRKAYALLTAARIGQQDWVEALRANEEGRFHYPDDAELLFQAGQLYQKVGRFDLARGALERLTQGTEGTHYRSVDTSLRSYRGHHELALLFRQMGDGPHCERMLREILGAHPEYLPARTDLVETLAGLGKNEEALMLFNGHAVTGRGPAEEEPLRS